MLELIVVLGVLNYEEEGEEVEEEGPWATVRYVSLVSLVLHMQTPVNRQSHCKHATQLCLRQAVAVASGNSHTNKGSCS